MTGAVVVSTPQPVAAADARKAIMMFKLPQINIPILGMIENMAYFTPAELPEMVRSASLGPGCTPAAP